jgi:hypothetical protein
LDADHYGVCTWDRLLCPAIVEHGTAVIAINRPNDWAVVAADSLFNKDDPSVPATLGCKIRKYGKFIVAVSGLYGRPGSSFDVWESFKKASAHSNSVMIFTKVAEADIAPGLVSAFLGDSARSWVVRSIKTKYDLVSI